MVIKKIIKRGILTVKSTALINLFFLSLLLPVWIVPCLAQYQTLRFDRLTIEDGLPNPSVMDILQDRDGFIWIGTLSGIVRYDGYEMKNYLPAAESIDSLPELDIPKFYQDKSGNLWLILRYQKAKLFKYDPHSDQFIPYLFDSSKSSEEQVINRSTSSIYEDKFGRLLVGTWGGGFYAIDVKEEAEGIPPEKIPYKHFVHIPGDPNSFSAPNNSMSRFLAEDGVENIWIPTDRGLCKFIPGEDRFETFLFTNDTIPLTHEFNTVLYDKPNTLWVGSAIHGLLKFDLKTERFVKQFQHDSHNAFSLANNTVNNIIEAGKGKYWVGAHGMLDIFDPETETFTHIRDISHDSWVENFKWNNALISDYSGNIWVGTWQKGIYKYNPDKGRFNFLLPSQKESLKNLKLFAQTDDSQKNIWLTSKGDGLVRWDRKNDSFQRFRHQKGNPNSLSSDWVGTVIEGSEGYLWIGTAKGLDRLDPKTGLVRRFQPYGELDSEVWNLGKEEIWTSRWGDGPCRLLDEEEGAFKCYLKTTKTLLSITALEKDKSGNIWIGINQNGMYCLDPKSGEFEYLIPNYGVHDIHFDAYDNCWLATHSGGLKLFDRITKQVIHLPKDVQNTIGIARTILEDKDGFLWMKTPRGIVKFDPKSRQVIRFFNKLNWMKSDAPWYSQFGGGFQTQEGELFFNYPEGVLYFHPDSLLRDSFPPKIALTDFQIFNKVVSSGKESPLKQDISHTKEIVLSYRQNDLTFSFSALHFKSPKENQYACFLKNHDRDWLQLGTETKTHYTNLNPGKYTFYIKASNSDGLWSEPLSLSLTILPPWWKTWWAYLLYAFSIGTIFFIIWKYELNRKLAKAEAQRLKELDDIKSRLYTNITHEFRTPLTIILGMAEQLRGHTSEGMKSSLDMIRRNGRQLLNLVNQMLDLSKLEAKAMHLEMIQGDVVNYLQYIIESFHSLAKSKDIRLHFLNKPEKLEMDYDPNRFRQVISNLLSNAIKFTPEGGNVYISLDKKDSFLEIKIRDTGIGIPSEKLPHIFERFYQTDSSSTRMEEGTGIGLALAKELVHLMNGEISADSHFGKGSAFIILLPITNNCKKEVILNFEGKPNTIAQQSNYEVSTNGNNGHTNKLPLLLLIEDNHDVIKYLLSCLNNEYQIEIAYNGEQGIEKAKTLIPDLIISDVMMPLKDGFEVCQTLKSDQLTSHIPIILLTAKADISSKLAGLKRGADAYLPKPFNKEELLVRIDKLLELRRRLQAHYMALASGPTINDSSKESSEREKMESAFVKKIRSIIEANHMESGFSVEDLCREAAMSNTQLYRKLKALTGQSANHFIRSVRLAKAKELMTNPELTIAEIAYDSGFSDPDYFSKLFKKETGQTPTEFRKS